MGFDAKHPGIGESTDRLIQHISRSIIDSPYISLTRSYGIAHDYAVYGRQVATKSKPAYIYEIEIPRRPAGLRLVDPIKEIAKCVPRPTQSMSYQHDGDRKYLLGVVSNEYKDYREAPILRPPLDGGTPRAPNLSPELESLVFALRDAEILAVGSIPAGYVITRYEVHERSVQWLRSEYSL